MPARTLVFRTALNKSPNKSLLGPLVTLFQGKPQVLSASLLGHMAKPSWCLLVSTIYFAPDCSNTLAQASGSKRSALNIGPNP